MALVVQVLVPSILVSGEVSSLSPTVLLNIAAAHVLAQQRCILRQLFFLEEM